MPLAYVFLPRDPGDGFSPFVRAAAALADRALSAARTARPGPSTPRGDRRPGPRPVASRGQRTRPGWPCAPRCGPRSESGPTVRCGRRARARRRAERGRRGGAPTGRRCRPARPYIGSDRADRFPTCCSSAANSSSSAAHTSGPFGCSTAALASLQRHREHPPPAALVAGSRRRDLPAEGRHRRRVDSREALQHNARATSRSSSQGSAAANRTRRGGRRSARRQRRTGHRSLEQLAELGRLAVDVTAAPRSRSSASIRPVPEAGIVDRHRARLPRRIRQAAAGRAAPGRCDHRHARSGRAEYPRSRA